MVFHRFPSHAVSSIFTLSELESDVTRYACLHDRLVTLDTMNIVYDSLNQPSHI